MYIEDSLLPVFLQIVLCSKTEAGAKSFRFMKGPRKVKGAGRLSPLRAWFHSAEAQAEEWYQSQQHEAQL
jgi:hypothetical protein